MTDRAGELSPFGHIRVAAMVQGRVFGGLRRGARLAVRILGEAGGHKTRPYEINRRYRGSAVDPIKNLSTECAACRPSLIAQTTSDWPRRMSPQANTFGLELR